MKPEDIIKVVKETTVDSELSVRDVIMLTRYFLHAYFKWLSLEAIAKLTGGAHHSTVISSLKSVDTHKRFVLIKHIVKTELDKRFDRHNQYFESYQK